MMKWNQPLSAGGEAIPSRWKRCASYILRRISLMQISRAAHPKHQTILPNIICVGALISQSGSILADDLKLKLIDGRGTPVCEAYVAARNAAGVKDVERCRLGQPLRGRGISRELLNAHFLNLTVPPTFEGPAEQQVRLAEINSALLHRHIIPFSAEVDTTLSGDALDDLIMENFAVYTLPVLSIDIDNDGIKDSVFFYLREPPSWSPTIDGVSYGAPIILGRKESSVDRERTLAILRQPIARALQSGESPSGELAQLALADFLGASNVSFFRFRGKTYFDVAFNTEAAANGEVADETKGIQRVFLSNGVGARAICTVLCSIQSKTEQH